MDVPEISDDVCLAALRGWCGLPAAADLSPYQQAPETIAAWRRAIAAAIQAMHEPAAVAADKAGG